jgi:hypothetical protein
VDANAGSVDLDLRQTAAVGDLTVKLNFGSATIRLPPRTLTGSLAINAGSAALCVPPGAGLRVAIESVAASNDFEAHGLSQVNGAWETPGFATADVRLELRATANAGSLSLDPPRSCAA